MDRPKTLMDVKRLLEESKIVKSSKVNSVSELDDTQTERRLVDEKRASCDAAKRHISIS